MQFPLFQNSLLYETVSRKRLLETTDDESRKKSRLNSDMNTHLSSVSNLYLYTGTPPHGYGTQAPKVAETISRAYSFNKKTKNKKITILGREIERMQWELEDGDFPFGEVHGNFIPSETRLMIENFLKKNCPYIDSCVESTMKRMLNTNADVLTKGKQTFCPFTNQSVTSATAYKRMYEFLTENSGMKCITCLEWIKAYMSLFEKSSIKYTTTTWEESDRQRFDKETKQWVNVKIKRKVVKSLRTETKDETRNLLLTISTRFASYLKHKERGKKDRRAIASANMILRMFLHIIEEFHLALSKEVEGSTISIGGEEKKQKIASNMSAAILPSGPSNYTAQGTEDATKWNECLSPSSFAMMHRYLFDDTTRTKLGLPPATSLGKLFSKIAVAGNFLMSMKEIQLGKGLMVYNDSEYSRLEWSREWIESMNKSTREWFEKVEPHLTSDGEFLKASPGMLMGMMNAGSTTLGLLATNHRMDQNQMRVMTLRSSDDSMSLYMGSDAGMVRSCVEMNYANLAMLGINLSPDKTFFFVHGIGEYTSWYMHDKFVSQFGVETASIRPKGKNPQDDFYSVAKETATALSTLTINHFGASARLRIGVDGVKRLWRIKPKFGRPDISREILLLADGGVQPWHCCNSHLEETCLRYHWAQSDAEKEYLLRIRNPNNPFSQDPFEEVVFSKEHGTLIAEEVDVPRTCFHYIKKSNRTYNRKDKKEEEETEKANNEVAKIINLIDPTTLIEYPTTNSSISSHLSMILKLERQCVELSPDEQELYEQAIKVLDLQQFEFLRETSDDQEFEYHEESDED